MKKLAIITFIFALLLIGCSSRRECPACGRETLDIVECPVCNMEVCGYCADYEHFIEKYYNSGEMKKYLEDRGYIVFDEQQDAFALYMYGFATGYNKGNSGIYDDEVKEAEGWDYTYLQKEYGNYGW